VLVAHNLGSAPAEVPLAVPGASAEPVFADPGAAIARDGAGWRATLPAGASGAWRVR